ncbi:MAG: homoserine dehydrogenase, partial [Actinomycetota bacterium]|nr:homoserine dehydrogenase [Actinomycetota bacterium]
MPPSPVNPSDNAVRVGLLGCGHVGGALVKLLSHNADLIKARTGVEIEVTRIAVHNLSKERDVVAAPGVFTNDAESVVNDPAV